MPPAYLAKALQALTAAGITESRPGPLGGYRLARPPAEVTLLEIVLAVDGAATAFRCSEIRRRGPAAADSPACLPPALRHRPRDVAGRGRVARRAGGHDRRRPDHRAHRDRPRRPSCCRGAEWIKQVEITRRSRA